MLLTAPRKQLREGKSVISIASSALRGLLGIFQFYASSVEVQVQACLSDNR